MTVIKSLSGGFRELLLLERFSARHVSGFLPPHLVPNQNMSSLALNMFDSFYIESCVMMFIVILMIFRLYNLCLPAALKFQSVKKVLSIICVIFFLFLPF